MAADLRLVAALLHVIKHVERMGDQCVNIAKMLPLVGYEPPSDELCSSRSADGRDRPLADRPGQAGLRAARRGLAEDLVRQDEEINRLTAACSRGPWRSAPMRTGGNGRCR